VDFKGKPEEARLGMNSWVESLTKGNIKYPSDDHVLII